MSEEVEQVSMAQALARLGAGAIAKALADRLDREKIGVFSPENLERLEREDIGNVPEIP